VENHKQIQIDEKGTTPPQLTVMSISVKTQLNQKQNTNEIVAISAVVHNSGKHSFFPFSFCSLLNKPLFINGLVDVDGQTKDPENGYTKFSAVRQVDSLIFPPGFKEALLQRKIKLEICKTERQMLSYFMGENSFLQENL